MKIKLLIPALLIFIILSGCSAMNGTDGDVYIAYSWVSISQVYTDDPSFGPTIYNDIYEDANEGTWYFEYTSLGEFWTGNYTVTRNPGAVLKDGDDAYFKLTLYSFGPSFYEWSAEYALSRHMPLSDDDGEYSETVDRGSYAVKLNAFKGKYGEDR